MPVPTYAVVVLTISVLWFAVVFDATSALKSGLFDQDVDQVLILNGATFDLYVNSSQTHSVILFYSSSCGHCQRFKQPYADLAHQLQDVRKTVVLAAINCVDSDNRPVCFKYNIQGYPSVLMFSPQNKQTPFEIDHMQSKPVVPFMVNQVAEALYGSDKFKTEWDAVEKLLDSSAKNLGNENFLTLFEIDEKSNLLSNNLALLASQYHAVKYFNVKVSQHDFDTNENLNSFIKSVFKSEQVKFPVLIYSFYDPTNAKMSSEVLNYGESEPLNYLSKMKVHLTEFYRSGPTLNEVFVSGYSKTDAETALNKVSDQNFKTIFKNRNAETIYVEDLMSALFYTLFQEIPLAAPLDNNAVDATKDFLKMVASFFPDIYTEDEEKNQNGETFSQSIRNNSLTLVNSLEASNDWTLQKWKDAVENAFKSTSFFEYFHKESRWVNCLGSEPHFRGFPCGLWTFFHTLQISAYSKNQQDTSVLTTMVKFITTFFSCLDCREHFQLETQNYKDALSDGKTSIKFLWKVHNSVNSRLKGDITEDPTHKKIQFPAFSTCPQCYFALPKSGIEADEISWNEPKVFLYLKKFYGAKNIRFYYSAKKLEEIQLMSKRHKPGNILSKKDDFNGQTKSSSLSKGDIIFLVALYSLSMTCIGVVCFYFQRKRIQRCRTNSKSRHSLA